MVVPADGGDPRRLAMSVARPGFRGGGCQGHMMGPPQHRRLERDALSQRPAVWRVSATVLVTVLREVVWPSKSETGSFGSKVGFTNLPPQAPRTRLH